VRDDDASGAIDALIDRALSIDGAALSAPVLERTVDVVLDHLGVALRGHAQPWTRSVRDVALAENAAPQATLYGGGRTSMRNAALVNGTAGHALELDDTHDRSLTHPGAVVIAAALAVAEARGSAPRALLAAIVAGYEFQCRVGLPLGAALIRRGVHPTASLGVFGAAMAAARLLDLSRASVGHAVGLAAAMSAGQMQFAHDPSGTMVKRLYGGLPAERGVLAAQLAAAGISAPRGAIDGEAGIARVLAGLDHAQWPPPRGDEPLEVMQVSFKPYACCRNFHALIEALGEIRDGRALSVDAIESVVVCGPAAMIDHHLERRPASTMAAQYSLPFTTAVALLADPRALDAFDAPARADPELLALADRVVARHDDAFERAFPEHFGGAAELRLRNGEVWTARRLDSSGTPADPLTRAALLAKYVRVTEGLVARPLATDLADAIEALPDASSLDGLHASLAAVARGFRR
jgi:2-methylcitrate dehydratase PrpD